MHPNKHKWKENREIRKILISIIEWEKNVENKSKQKTALSGKMGENRARKKLEKMSKSENYE